MPAPAPPAAASAAAPPPASSWRVDETYVQVRGKWVYLYRGVDREGQTFNFMISERRELAGARRFFKIATASNGVPEKVVIDKSGANLAGLQDVNTIVKFTSAGDMIEILQIKYLNNIFEQDHRFIKRITNPMIAIKALHSALATIAGTEVAHMIRKKPLTIDNRSPFQILGELTA